MFQDNCLAKSFSVPWVGGRVGQLKMRWDKSVHEREQIYLKEFPGLVDVRESRNGRPLSKFDGCMKTLPVGLSEVPDSSVLRWFSNNSQRDVYFDKNVVR